MNDNLPLDPRTSALLVMDFQTAIVDGPPIHGDTANKEATVGANRWSSRRPRGRLR
jgi:hypothetical protein